VTKINKKSANDNAVYIKYNTLICSIFECETLALNTKHCIHALQIQFYGAKSISYLLAINFT